MTMLQLICFRAIEILNKTSLPPLKILVEDFISLFYCITHYLLYKLDEKLQENYLESNEKI